MNSKPFPKLLLATQSIYHSSGLKGYLLLIKSSFWFPDRSLTRESVRWIRQLTVLLIGLFFTCAVLEIDLGDTGDDFGDVYDTYVHGKPLQLQNPTAVDCQQILPANLIITHHQYSLPLPIDWLAVLAVPSLAFLLHRRLKRRRLQVVHAVWRL